MRKRVYVVASVAGTVLVAGAAITTALVSHTDSTKTSGTERTKLVSYRGYQTEVPASWPVYDLSDDPTRCVRFDQHAVYLGRPGADQTCPARAVGHTESLLVEPLDATTDSGSGSQPGTVHADLAGAQVSVTASYQADQSLAASFLQPDATATRTGNGPAVTGTAANPSPTATSPASSGSASSDTATPGPSDTTPPGPSVTATPSPSDGATPSDTATPGPTDTVMPSDTASGTPPASPTPPPSDTLTPNATSTPNQTTTPPPVSDPTLSSGDSTSPPPSVSRSDLAFSRVSSSLLATGLGFDTCEAPSPAAMSAWASTNLDSVNIYIGGPNRACGNANLTAAWVTTVRGYGYSFIPTYVGLQAPCYAPTKTTVARITPTQAATQGTRSAEDAAALMRALGFGHGNPVYLNMEAYDNSQTSCTTAVLTYTSAFVTRLHSLGYAAGFYSSAASGAHDLAAAFGSATYAMPDALWFARWNNTPDLDSEPYVPDTLWQGRRIHQYAGDHVETHGGTSINIDSDYLQGVVALPGNY